MKRGARPDRLSQALYASQSLAAVRLQAEAMLGLELYCGGAFAEVCVPQALIERCGASILDADSLAERARDIEGVRVAALFKQDNEVWRVSLRARSFSADGVGARTGSVDVAAIAQRFGGGGHKPAAAFRWRGDLEGVRERLRSEVQTALRLVSSVDA